MLKLLLVLVLFLVFIEEKGTLICESIKKMHALVTEMYEKKDVDENMMESEDELERLISRIETAKLTLQKIKHVY